jgi:hypothetical protein
VKHGYGGVKLALERNDPDFGRKIRVGVSTILNWDCTKENILKNFVHPLFTGILDPLIRMKRVKGPKITDSAEGSSYLNFWRTCSYSFN